MPKMAGVQRTEWANCDRCGFVHPIGMLSMQLGLNVCRCHGCWDDLSNEYRAKIISESIGDSVDETTDKPEMFKDSGELTF